MSKSDTTRAIEEALRKRYPSDAYALIFQVPDRTGANQSRTADALVFGLWPSRGLDVEGIEIKASRSDWRKEIADPSKAAQFARHCHRWWIAAPPGVVESGELPPAWGLLELKRGVLRQAIEAPRTESPDPIPHEMWVAIMRAVQRNELRAVEARRREIEAEAKERIESTYERKLEGWQQLDQRFQEAMEAHGQRLTSIRYVQPEVLADCYALATDERDLASSVRRAVDVLRKEADRIAQILNGDGS